MRAFCDGHAMVYQGFSLLTANGHALGLPAMRALCVRTGLSATQVVFRFALSVGMLPLTGTSSAAHLREDLAALDAPFDAAAVQAVEHLGG